MRSNSAVGVLELKRVAQGIAVLDAMTKTAEVDILSAGPVCPGKYIIVVGGEVSSVTAAMSAVSDATGGIWFDSFTSGALHPDVIPAICGMGREAERGEAIGIVETFSVASAICAADSAAKSADVKINDVRLAKGMGGRGFVRISGSVGAVAAAVESGARKAADDGMLVDSVVLARPHPALLEQL